MKNIMSFILVIFSFSLVGQHGYIVTTLDSIVTTVANQGVYGLSTVVKNKNVHLVYIYGTAEGSYQLIYEIRKNGKQLSREIVHQYTNSPWLDPRTAIQFDKNNTPYIYCAQIVDGQTYITIANRTTGNWNINTIDYKHRQNWLHNSGNIYEELGFVTAKNGDGNNNWQPIIHYFGYESGSWGSHTISASSFPKGDPICFHHGKEVYVAYAEQHNDTVQVFVHKKFNNKWELELKLTYPQASHANYWCKFGVSNGLLRFFHTYDKSTYSQPLSHFEKSKNGWNEIPIVQNRDQYLYERVAGNNIDVDNKQNSYFLNRDLIFVLNNNQEYFEYPNPLGGPFYKYYDMSIIDDEIYLYFIAGNKNFPWGDPVMFYEAVGLLSNITSTYNSKKALVNNYTLSPNPGHVNYVLKLDMIQTCKVNLQWINSIGVRMGQGKSHNLNKGINTLKLINPVSQSGLFYLLIISEKGELVIPVVQQRK